MLRKVVTAAMSLAVLMTVSANAADVKLKAGNPGLKSAGPLTFGPPNILFVGDTLGATVVAIKVDAPTGGTSSGVTVEGLNGKLAAKLGTTARNILINDIAAQPGSGRVFLSASRGRGPEAKPVIASVGGDGKISVLSLEKVAYAKAALPNAPKNITKPPKTRRRRRFRNPRLSSITDLQYVDGKVIVAGLSNEEFASKLRIIPFPFRKTAKGNSVEIFHGAHGKYETRSPIRTFVPYTVGGKTQVVAAYTCTPLVKFPVGDLDNTTKLRGTTVAELGNGNAPLDIIVYSKGGKNYLLMANNRRGVMKISTKNIDKIKGITEPVSRGKKAGLPYETIEDLKGVVQLDKLNSKQAVILVKGKEGSLDLKTIDLP